MLLEVLLVVALVALTATLIATAAVEDRPELRSVDASPARPDSGSWLRPRD
jgi:hypothetical protein